MAKWHISDGKVRVCRKVVRCNIMDTEHFDNENDGYAYLEASFKDQLLATPVKKHVDETQKAPEAPNVWRGTLNYPVHLQRSGRIIGNNVDILERSGQEAPDEYNIVLRKMYGIENRTTVYVESIREKKKMGIEHDNHILEFKTCDTSDILDDLNEPTFYHKNIVNISPGLSWMQCENNILNTLSTQFSNQPFTDEEKEKIEEELLSYSYQINQIETNEKMSQIDVAVKGYSYFENPLQDPNLIIADVDYDKTAFRGTHIKKLLECATYAETESPKLDLRINHENFRGEGWTLYHDPDENVWELETYDKNNNKYIKLESSNHAKTELKKHLKKIGLNKQEEIDEMSNFSKNFIDDVENILKNHQQSYAKLIQEKEKIIDQKQAPEIIHDPKLKKDSFLSKLLHTIGK